MIQGSGFLVASVLVLHREADTLLLHSDFSGKKLLQSSKGFLEAPCFSIVNCALFVCSLFP